MELDINKVESYNCGQGVIDMKVEMDNVNEYNEVVAEVIIF